MQLAALRPFIQCLNIFQPMFKPITAQIDFVLRDRVEHERVVWVGRMPKCKGFSGILCHLEFVVQDRIRLRCLYKRLCNSIYALSSEPNEFTCSPRSLRVTAEWRHARVGIGASHSEAATVQQTAAARVSRGG